MTQLSAFPHTPHGARFYIIRIADQLDPDWNDWFDNMQITHTADAPTHTILAGYVRDQAELFGILYKLGGLNLTLLSVQGHDSEKEE